MTSSKLGHTTASEGQPRGAPAQNDGGAAQAGNTSSLQGASNPATTAGQKQPDGPAQEIAGTLPNDFTLKGMKAEYKGEDKTVPNPVPGGDGAPFSTYGPGGDSTHRGAQSHDFSVPETEDASRPRENTGDNKKY